MIDPAVRVICIVLLASSCVPPRSAPAPAPARSRAASATSGPARHGRFAAAVTTLANQLEARYVLRDVGARYAAALRAQLARGAYDAVDDRDALAVQLTRDLQTVAPDGHLRVASEAMIRSPSSGRPLLPLGGPGPGQRSAGATRPDAPAPRGPRRPPAIADMAWLADGVAYIRFNEFPDEPDTVAAVDRFMAAHATATSLIIDARDHHGGGMAEMNTLLSYLYAAQTPLVDMEVSAQIAGQRSPLPAAGAQLREVPAPPGLVRREHVVVPHPTEHRLFTARVFYLTSTRTFSAAEHLAFALKRTGRATLIGERTGGGNHFGDYEPVGAGLLVFLPVGRTIDPVTGADWEGVGVAPDIAVPADQALEAALRLATRG